MFLVYLMLIASKMTYVYCGVLCTLGIAFHCFQKVVKHYNWVAYAEAPKRIKKKIPRAAKPSARDTEATTEASKLVAI